MHTLGEYKSASISIDGKLLITFEVNEKDKVLAELEPLSGKLLSIDAKPYRQKRSLDANAYFWKLCELIAQSLESDRWTIYLMMLRDYGMFIDLYVEQDNVDNAKSLFRCTEILYEDAEQVCLRGYYGSHTYDTKQMSILISGTVREAQSLGIETLTETETDRLLREWRPKDDTKR